MERFEDRVSEDIEKSGKKMSLNREKVLSFFRGKYLVIIIVVGNLKIRFF